MVQSLLLRRGVRRQERREGNQEAPEDEFLQPVVRLQHIARGRQIVRRLEWRKTRRDITHDRQDRPAIHLRGHVRKRCGQRHKHQLLHFGDNLRSLHPLGVRALLLQPRHRVLLKPHHELQHAHHHDAEGEADEIRLRQRLNKATPGVDETHAVLHLHEPEQVLELTLQDQHRAPGDEAADQGLRKEANEVRGLAQAEHDEPNAGDERKQRGQLRALLQIMKVLKLVRDQDGGDGS
mmetsp:Transcript_23067/g.66206  ORF Transcript_23067/g.66206 Transcript_23067/m.66206 type:complete len:236 (-) Transcript_23067:553-1260(-)